MSIAVSSKSKPVTPLDFIASSLDHANRWPKTERLDPRIRFNARTEATMLIEGLRTFGYEIVPRTEEPARVDFAPRKEIELAPGNVVRLTPEGEAAIRAFVQSVPQTQDAVSAGIEALEHSLDRAEAEAEVDDWGMREHGANDLARRYGCRVTVSGRDDPRNPNSYEADDGDHAVVTERLTGRLVGLTECWYSEDGDPIVPKTWLEAVLLAWEANAKALRASA